MTMTTTKSGGGMNRPGGPSRRTRVGLRMAVSVLGAAGIFLSGAPSYATGRAGGIGTTRAARPNRNDRGVVDAGGEVDAKSPAPSPGLISALTAAVRVPSARVEVLRLERAPGTCDTSRPDARAEIERPIDGSGRVAVKLMGTRGDAEPCEVWAWVSMRVWAKVPVTQRAVRAGEPLASAITFAEREIRAGHLPADIGPGAVADRWLAAGRIVDSDLVRAAGPATGQTVKVVIQAGALVIEESGRVVPCVRGRACAVLPSGRRLEGDMNDGRLMVSLP